MKRKDFTKAACGLLLSAACALGVMVGVSGCVDDGQASAPGMVEVDVTDTSGGVAATVNGVEIGENAVSAYIANFRAANGLESDDDWAAWLLDYAYSIDSIRGETLAYFENQELVRQVAEANGISVGDDQVDEAVELEKSGYDGEGAWLEHLAQIGMAESGYRDYVKLLLLSQAILDEMFADEADDVVAQQEAYSNFMFAFRDASTIIEEFLPDDAPYYVDLDLYVDGSGEGETGEQEASGDEDGSEEAGDE